MNWGLLPPATKAMKEKSKLAKGRFTGDPSHEFEHIQTRKSGDGEEAHEEEETVSVLIMGIRKQEDRVVVFN